MRIIINKQNNDKLKSKKMFLLQSGIIPLSFLPTSGLFCKDATHIVTGTGVIQRFFIITWFLFITHTKVFILLVLQTVNSPGVEFMYTNVTPDSHYLSCFGFSYCISDRVIIRQTFLLICHLYSSNIVLFVCKFILPGYGVLDQI